MPENTEPMKLDDRAYVVTGAASGIGRAVAEEISHLGAGVILADRDEAGLMSTAHDIEADGGRCAVVPGDVTEPGHPEMMVATCQREFGRIDGLIPAAGRIIIRSIPEVKREEWESVLGLNLTATFFGAREVAEAIVAEGHSGSIVTISSTSAHGARPNNIDYGVSKIGVDHVTRTMAMHYAQAGIRVNAVSPGVFDTPMWHSVDRDRGAQLGLAPGEVTQRMVEAIPMGRLGNLQEIARLIIYLLSDDAAYVTGQIIEIDGGFKLANP